MAEKTFNLVYHITAVDRPMLWYNLYCLKPHLHRFNGKKIITIVKLANDQPTRELMHFNERELQFVDNMAASTIQRVIQYLDDPTVDFMVVNNSSLADSGHFYDVVAPELETMDPDDFTWYGHSKSVRYRTETHNFPALVMWANVLYEMSLRRFDDMYEKLVMGTEFDCYGGAKHDGQDFAFCGVPSVNWHYSGAMFWFRTAALFANPDWYDPSPIKYKFEYLLPRCVPSSRAYTPWYLPTTFPETGYLADGATWDVYMESIGQKAQMYECVDFARSLTDATLHEFGDDYGRCPHVEYK